MYFNIDNECRFKGRLTADPELKGEEGKQYIIFSLGTKKYNGKNADGEHEYGTVFPPFIAYGNDAIRIAKASKGDVLEIVSTYETYEKTDAAGKKYYNHSFVVCFCEIQKRKTQQ